MRIGIVAGESSGDQIGAGLIAAIRARVPDATFEGVCGEGMVAAGCQALYPADKLAIVGLVEVLEHYRELRRMRAQLAARFLRTLPDLFIGIDVPDFNLGLERRLKSAGIRTVHYVGPQIWAWRRYRVRRLARSVDLLLTLFPFEANFYRQHDVRVEYVGHPLADQLPLEPDRAGARTRLGLPDAAPVIALLPGSRVSELRHHADLFVRTAEWCLARRPDLRFVVPMASQRLRALFRDAVERHGQALPLQLLDGQSRAAMEAADVVLLASGTATLEALLLKRPMVVTYRLAWINYLIVRRLVKVEHYSLPNLLGGTALVPELVQTDARPDRLGRALLAYLEEPDRVRRLEHEFAEIHRGLRQDTNRRAADAVLALARA